MTNLSLPDVQELDQRTHARELVRLFQLAENKIKLVENLNGELSIPAINELRYAGYHMAQYLAGTGEASETQLSKAENHCKRAIYDAVEAGIINQLELIKKFQDDFAGVAIKDVIPHYAELRKQIKAAQNLLSKSKEEKQKRADYYEECSGHLENLRATHEELEESRDDLVRQLTKTNREVRNYFMMGATLFVCTVAMIYTALSYHKPVTDPAIALQQSTTALLPTSTEPNKDHIEMEPLSAK